MIRATPEAIALLIPRKTRKEGEGRTHLVDLIWMLAARETMRSKEITKAMTQSMATSILIT